MNKQVSHPFYVTAMEGKTCGHQHRSMGQALNCGQGILPVYKVTAGKRDKEGDREVTLSKVLG